MKSKRFKEPKAGEWVQPIKKGYLLACCDCALVHRMDFQVVNDRAQFRVWRARNQTARLRRLSGITLKTKEV